MGDRREFLLFGVLLLLAGALAGFDLTDRYVSRRVPSPRRLDVADLDPVARVQLDVAKPLDEIQRELSIFSPPRELTSLDPLSLPAPPLPQLSVRRPSVLPGFRGSQTQAYRMNADEVGHLEFGEMVDDGLGMADPFIISMDEEMMGNETVTEIEEEVVPLETRFDWVTQVGAARRTYGMLLNEDPHGLRDRPDEDIRLQQVSERSGRPLGAPYVISRSEVLDFGFAMTFENDYVFRSRSLGTGPGSASSRRSLALDMLAAWPAEPAGLDFALTEAQLAWDVDPGSASGARLLASLNRKARDLEGELSVYREAVEQGTADASLLAAYGDLCLRLGLTERAEELVVAAALNSRTSAEVAIEEGLLLESLGDDVAAETRLLAAESMTFAGPLEEDQERSHRLALGRVQVGLGHLSAADRQANRLLLDHPDDVEALILKAAVAAAMDDLVVADETLASVLASDPGNAQALMNAGVVAWRRGDGLSAKTLLEQSIDAAPFYAVAPTLALGFLYEDAGEPETARDLYAQALLLEPENSETLYRMGRNQRLDGDPEEATLILREALRLDGPETLLLCELGVCAIDRGEDEEAMRYFREALRIEPNNGEAGWLLGLAMLAKGDTRSAETALEQATTDGFPGAHASLGTALYMQNRVEEALSHFDEVIKAYAGDLGHPQAAYSIEQAEAIRLNRSKRQWLDRFRRSSLQRGWSEHQWDGSPRVLFSPGDVHVSGRMEKPREDERPGISRVVEGKTFEGASIELKIDPNTETRCGLALTYRQVKGAQGRLPKARLDIWVDEMGVVRTSVLDNFDTDVRESLEIGTVDVSGDQPIVLGIERVDAVAGLFRFTIGGRSVSGDVALRSLRNFVNPFDLEIYVTAAPGRIGGASISLCRIIQIPG
ncbi:MAG: tetratricopeptide repeat protein [Planctomycetota bacterium]|nr:tetratricopeptide repeat protein [Planctomycetota bacterium]